jgi:predicted methyltransferase
MATVKAVIYQNNKDNHPMLENTYKTLTACWLVAGLLSASVSLVAQADETPPQSPSTETKLRKILDGEHRSAAHKARDTYRHPVETLTWFGIQDDMTVVEIYPGGGWYAEILAPFLKDNGLYYGAGYDAESSVSFYRRGARQFREKMEEKPHIYGNVLITELAPPTKTAIAPPGSADMVLTFRNVHNWMAGGYAQAVFDAMYKALKPGGILGLVEHRGDENTPQDPKAKSGYVNESYAVKLAENAGFKLVDKSDINANPKDTKNYEKGVWTLPPTLALKDKNREQYLDTGESDRMTLKFVKP